MIKGFEGFSNSLKFLHIPKNAGTSIEKVGYEQGILWGYKEWTKNNKQGERIYDFHKLFKHNSPWIHKLTNLEAKNNRCFPWHLPLNDLDLNIYSKDDKIFTIVRNPYTKIVSSYKYGTKNPTKDDLNIFIHQKLSNFEKNKYWNSCHILPQYEYTENSKIKIDYILKFENMDNDFIDLMKKNNINITELPKKNSSKKPVSVSDLTQESKDLIYKVYKKDFELFGYNK